MREDFLQTIKIKRFNDIQKYKKMFESEKITEEEIPEACRKEIRKIYIQKILELRQRKGN